MIKNSKVIGANINPDDYHRSTVERGHAQYPVSPSMLKEFGRCASRWVRGYVGPETDAKDWGKLLDMSLMTPNAFKAKVILAPTEYPAIVKKVEVMKPWTFRATYCKEWREEKEAQGLMVLTQKEVDEVRAANKSVMQDEVMAEFINSSDKQVLVTAEWHDPTTGLVIPLRCLIDLAPRSGTEFGSCLGDFKTTFCASPFAFRRMIHKMGYHVQAAFDLDLYRAATGEDRNTWCLLIQESFPPWQTAKQMLSEDYVELGRRTYRSLLARYCSCIKLGIWPDYDLGPDSVQGWSLAEPESWMLNTFTEKTVEGPTVDDIRETEDNFDTLY